MTGSANDANDAPDQGAPTSSLDKVPAGSSTDDIPVATPSDTAVSPVGRLLGAASLLAIGNIASRMLGFVRTRTITSLFGLGIETDSFFAASKVPTAIYNLLIGGQLSAALVPVLSDYAAREKRAELWRAFSVLATAAAIALSTVALAVALAAPWLAARLTPEYGPEGVALVAASLRIMAPSIVVFGLAGVLTGLLLALERFAFAAAAGAAYNAAMIITILMFHDRLGPLALPAGVLIGSLGQIALLLPGLRDVRPRLTGFRHPALRRVLTLYAPIAAALLVTDVALPVVDVRLAAAAGPAARGTLDVATQLTQFPHGLIAVAISLAILPALSAAHARNEQRTFARTLARGLRTVLTLALPAAVGLAVLGEPLVGAVYQSGAFGATDRVAVALALSIYLIGLPFAAIDWPLNYAFYARQNTWLPALTGVGSVGVWLAVALALGPFDLLGLPAHRGFVALALADSAKHIAHALVMAFLAWKLIGHAALAGVWRTALAAGTAAGLMGVAVFYVDAHLAATWPATAWGFAGRTAVGVSLGVAIYLPLAARLGVSEVAWLADTVRHRLMSR